MRQQCGLLVATDMFTSVFDYCGVFYHLVGVRAGLGKHVVERQLSPGQAGQQKVKKAGLEDTS